MVRSFQLMVASMFIFMLEKSTSNSSGAQPMFPKVYATNLIFTYYLF